MSRNWIELEGVSLAGRYWLKQCLSSTANEAWYLTRFDNRDAAVRVLPADLQLAGERLEDWREALRIEHPNIVRMLDAGHTDAAGLDLIYAVCEYPDDFLAAALAEHPLSPAEAGEVLEACLAALGFLHRNGFVHGAVATERIVAIGDRIKLPSDTIHRPRARRADVALEAYDAPEVAAGGVFTPAADMWSLGVMLVEVLRRDRTVVAGGEVGYLPEPFATVVRDTLRENPVERWSIAEVEARIHPPAAVAPAKIEAQAPALAAMPPPEIQTVPEVLPAGIGEPAEPRVRPSAGTAALAKYGLGMKWVPLAGVLSAIALGAVFLPRTWQPAAKPAAAPVAAPVTTIVNRPASAPVAPPPEAEWRLVVYEYARRSDAELEARRLNRQRPAWHAEVFAPRTEGAPYFVTLGGLMTRPEAERLKRKARAAGLPRDTFVRNFPSKRAAKDNL